MTSPLDWADGHTPLTLESRCGVGKTTLGAGSGTQRPVASSLATVGVLQPSGRG
jgi:hypothetical protein